MCTEAYHKLGPAVRILVVYCSLSWLEQGQSPAFWVKLLSAHWQHQQYATEDGSCCCSYLVLAPENKPYYEVFLSCTATSTAYLCSACSAKCLAVLNDLVLEPCWHYLCPLLVCPLRSLRTLPLPTAARCMLAHCPAKRSSVAYACSDTADVTV